MSGMSKITFRADDELVDAIESFDASKSEIMREALRSYLEQEPAVDLSEQRSRGEPSAMAGDSIDALLVDRIDELIEQRLDGLIERRLDRQFGAPQREPQDVNVSITLDGVSDAGGTLARTQNEPAPDVDDEPRSASDRKTHTSAASTGTEPTHECGQCGESLSDDHVYCPNCGEKASRRLFCDCGDELRSDWAFCPSCGRRTPAADVLDPT